MSEPIYTISQVSALVGKKSYVLRYWEDELAIPIGRNEMGHRYYTGNDVQLFLNIKELQRRGLQLRAIKELIPKLYCQEPGQSDSPIKVLPGETCTSDDNPSDSCKPVADPEESSDFPGLDAYKMQEFQTILRKLITQGLKEQKARERERRSRSLDAAIRYHQQSRRQAAATLSSRSSPKIKRFRKKNIQS